MQLSLPGRRSVVAHAFPSSDPAFAEAVREAMTQAREQSADVDTLRTDVETRLRRRYRNVRLVPQEAFGTVAERSEAWYFFRDGRVRPTSSDRERLYQLLARSHRTMETTDAALRQSRELARVLGQRDED